MLTTRPDEMLTHDHSEIDALMEKIVILLSSGAPEPIYKAIDLFWARLAIHIRAEHLHLFPALTEASRLFDAAEAAAITNRIEELHEDHNFFMREMMGAIKTMRQIIANADGDELSRLGEVKDRLGNVRRRLIIHNRKEESEIYPLADRLLSPDAAGVLRTNMKRELDNLPPRFVVSPKQRSMISPIDNDSQLIEGFVLAGGASSRMGQDKAYLVAGGMQFFERAVAALSPLCHGHVSVVGGTRADLAFQTSSDVAFLQDLLEIQGTKLPQASIVGLYTALACTKMPWIAILACDLPFVTGDLMIRLAGYRADEIDAIVPLQSDANPQPLCAIYNRVKCLPVVKNMIEKGELKMRTVVSTLHSRFVDFNKLADLSGSANFFFNVNNPEDHESALKIAGD